MDAAQIMGFGDVRRSILQAIADIRSGDLDVNRGAVMAALFKVLNENVQTEVNAAKMALATEGKAHQFGRVVGMGRRLIGNDTSQEA